MIKIVLLIRDKNDYKSDFYDLAIEIFKYNSRLKCKLTLKQTQWIIFKLYKAMTMSEIVFKILILNVPIIIKIHLPLSQYILMKI